MSLLIVAEAGANHLGDREKMLKLCDAAKEAGADAVKFQAYDTDKLLKRRGGEGDGELLKKCELSDSDFKAIAEHCEKIGLTWFASVFDLEQVRRMRGFNMPYAKISHKEAEWMELVELASDQFERVFVSFNLTAHMHESFFTGNMALGEDAMALIEFYQSHDNLTLVHCIGEYPAKSPPRFDLVTNEGMIPVAGFSSHYPDWRVPAASAIRGVDYIEAHLKLTDDDPEADWSLNVEDFGKMVKQIREYESWL